VLGDDESDDVDLAVEEGDAAAEIARHAKEQQPDLLVIGAPGQPGDALDLVQQVITSTRCSVLVVRDGIAGQARRPA
jgi:nucleotide-binding universal stress UspA family protein